MEKKTVFVKDVKKKKWIFCDLCTCTNFLIHSTCIETTSMLESIIVKKF